MGGLGPLAKKTLRRSSVSGIIASGFRIGQGLRMFFVLDRSRYDPKTTLGDI